MATQVLIPILGEAITSANLLAWLKEPGDPVRRGDELAELETEKATLIVECPTNGVLLSIHVTPGATVYPGQLAAVVGQPGEEIENIPVPEALSPDNRPAPPLAPAKSQADESESLRASPAARRRAKELGVDLDLVTPSKPGARITAEDVEHYLESTHGKNTHKNQPAYHRLVLNPTRKTLAEKMLASAAQIPQFTISVDMLADRLLAYKLHRKEQGYDISLTAILIYVTARTIQNHPLINSSYDREGVSVFETVNMAVAVATSQGLVAPVIYGAEMLDLATIAQQLDQLVQTARNARLSLDQVQNATFTISNLGMHGVHQFTPLVNPPQAAILGVGGIRPAIIPSASGAQPVQLINLTVSADHRVLDGVLAAQFLAELRENLEGFH